MRRIASLCLVLTVVASTTAAFAAGESNWPRWRGPHQDGHTAEKGLPTSWSAADVTWQTPLKGQGHSSPVIWGERIFLTAALERGRRRMVMCLDRNGGDILWERIAWTGSPEPSHRMNGWASATCSTDGKRVYAFFGRGGGLFCYTADGELLWQRNLGRFEGPWGTAACPVLVDDLVIQNCDSDRNAYIIALDKRTGEQVWRTEREDHRGWSTPILIEAAGRRELVVNGHTGVRAYDPATGAELWYCQSFNGRGTPTVTPSSSGLLHAVNGLRGDTYAVRPGGSGDVTETHMAWHTSRSTGRDLPSPLAIDQTVLIASMSGVLTAYDAAGGKELWRERLGGRFSATPVAWDGKAFFLNEDGEAVVIDPKAETKIVGRNRLDPADEEIFRASITPSDGQLFIRSDRVLYCIGDRRPPTGQ